MANTNATGKATGHTAQADVIVWNGTLINTKEILHARNENRVVGYEDQPTSGCWIEFKRKGTLFVPGLTVEGLGNLISGDVF